MTRVRTIPRSAPLDEQPAPRSPKNPMLTGLTRTLCRLFAALVCLLCASEVFGFSPVASEASAEHALRVGAADDQSDATTQAPDTREEREEREGDDEDEDIDDSRHLSWATFPSAELVRERSVFPRALVESAPDKSHHSLDPRPPRRA
jgi:hypothetical protein